MASERLLPHALDAEIALLASAVADAAVIDAASPLVRPQSFYALIHGRIWSALVALRREDAPCDRVALIEYLRANGELERMGGVTALASLHGSAQTPDSALYYARIIAEKHRLRRIIAAAGKIRELGYQGEESPAQAASDALRVLSDAIDEPSQGDLAPLASVLESYYDDIAAVAAYRTPCHLLDRLTGGFTGGELVVWASSAGVGKSFALTQLAHHVAATYGPCAMFATEMGAAATRARLIALVSGVSARRQRELSVAPEIAFGNRAPSRAELDAQREAVRRAISALRRVPIYLSDQTMSSDDLIARARREHRRVGGLKSIFIDTLGALSDVASHSGPGKDPGVHERQKRVVWSLKALAKELDIPIHVAHHFSRAADYKGVAAAPSKERLRDGGGLENTATTIIFPHRALIVEKEAGKNCREWPHWEYSWIVDKARDGSEGTIPMNFLGAEARWEERDGPSLRMMPADDAERLEAASPAPSDPLDDGAQTDLLDYAAERFSA